jgi:aspartate beta-hydroxylase
MASEPPLTFESTTNSGLEIARTHVRQGNLAEAERVYRQVVATQPDQVEALRFLANAALSRGNPGDAVAMLSRAAQTNRNNLGVLLELGVAYRSAQRMDEARSVFERAVELSQGGNTTARVLLANVYELDGRPEMALPQYFRAILDAQANGLWLNDSTTEPGLRQLVQHAMQYVDRGRHDLFGGALEPFRQGSNATRLGRVDAALATYLHERPEAAADLRQKPTFLHVPDPAATCFPDVAAFGWLAEWSTSVSSLSNEAKACIESIAEGPRGVTPFSLDAMMAAHDAGGVATPDRRVPFYRRGMFQDSMRTLAPQLSALLASAPLVHIPNYAPDAEILMLQPGVGTAILRGRTNAFCTVATAFAGSAPLKVTVGGESRQLIAGRSLVFDPSFGFDYAAGDGLAFALVFEVWNPGISRLERDALTALIQAVVDFDSRLQDLA